MAELFEGVRADDVEGGEELRTLAALLAARGQIAYRVAPSARKIDPDADGRGDKRVAIRRRVRLRSGKLLDADNRFVSECLILDQSKTGWRIKLARNVGAPKACRIYEDDTGELAVGMVVWRREGLLGIRKLRSLAPSDVKPFTQNMLRGRYYAVKN